MSRDVNRGIDPASQYVTSGFKGNSTDATLSRMLGKDVNSKPQFCAECGKKCDVAYKSDSNSNGVDVFCKEHYEQLFSSKCEGCNKAIMGVFVNADNGKKYHEQCYSRDVSCGNCGKIIIGEAMQACKKNWHPKCFTCTMCYSPLGTSFVEKSGLPYCSKCGNQSSGFSSETKVVSSNKQEHDQKNKEHQDLHKNVNMGKNFCAECGKIMGFGEAVVLHDSMFHPQCFICAKCRTPLKDSPFREISGQPHCSNCAGGTGTGGFCAGCGQNLVGAYFNALGSKWHKDCFVCTTCKKPFQGGYAEKDGSPYCAGCVQKTSGKSTLTNTHVGERKPGFTIDPRTGAKSFK